MKIQRVVMIRGDGGGGGGGFEMLNGKCYDD
jgi:hypothetical protein